MRLFVIGGTLIAMLTLLSTPQEHPWVRLIAALVCGIGVTIMVLSGPPRGRLP